MKSLKTVVIIAQGAFIGLFSIHNIEFPELVIIGIPVCLLTIMYGALSSPGEK